MDGAAGRRGTLSLRPVTPLGLLAAQLDHVRELAARTGDADLLAQVDDARVLAAGLDPYLEACTTPESPALADLAARTRTHDWGGSALEGEMLSGHVEGQFLKLLVHATRATRVLEIGLFTGYSALAMAEALPADGTLIALELDADVAAFAARAFADAPAGARIDVRVGPAEAALRAMAAAEERPFDLVFIDADKGGYTTYLDTILEAGLLAPHGLLCVDNTLMQGQPWQDPAGRSANGAAIAAFNAAVVADPRVEQVLVPLRDGVTLMRWSA